MRIWQSSCGGRPQHWRWWMRLSSHFMDICPCVDLKQFALYQRGYRVAAWREQGAIYTDGKNVIYFLHHSYGR
jgi:hypothetical protein